MQAVRAREIPGAGRDVLMDCLLAAAAAAAAAGRTVGGLAVEEDVVLEMEGLCARLALAQLKVQQERQHVAAMPAQGSEP